MRARRVSSLAAPRGATGGLRVGGRLGRERRPFVREVTPRIDIHTRMYETISHTSSYVRPPGRTDCRSVPAAHRAGLGAASPLLRPPGDEPRLPRHSPARHGG